MPWYIVAMIALCAIISPFEALYLYNKAQEMKRRRKEREKNEDEGDQMRASG